MDSKSWLMYQLDSTKSDSTEEGAGKYSFPWLLKSLKFYIIAFSPQVHNTSRQTSLAPMVASQLRCHCVSFKTFRVINTLIEQPAFSQSFGFLCTPASPRKPTWNGFFPATTAGEAGLPATATDSINSWQLILLVHLLAVLSYTHFPDHASLH